MAAPLYDDGRIACDSTSIRIGWYYPWGGSKSILYSRIKAVVPRPLTGVVNGRWRIWGSGDFVHWWNLDTRRPNKTMALELDLGRRVRPTITPDDAEAVERILQDHISR